MAKRQNKIGKRTLFALLMSAGLICLFVPQGFANKLRFAFSRTFHKPLGICRNITSATYKRPSSANAVEQSKYINLRNHLANNMQWLRQERRNVEKLSGLRNKSAWEGVDFVLADVITAFMDVSCSAFIVNRGKDDGLAKDQFVLSNRSIIGVVSDLDSRTALVRLVTDPKFKTAVKIGDPGLQGIMQGNGNNSARVQLLPKKHKIKTGDIVYVRKKPGFLNVPMIAGTVTQCKANDENPLLWDITVKPVCDIQRLNSVTVIVMNSQDEESNLIHRTTGGSPGNQDKNKVFE